MITDKEKLEWIAEHMTGFSIGIDNNAILKYINKEGKETRVEAQSDNVMISPIELLNLALEKSINYKNSY